MLTMLQKKGRGSKAWAVRQNKLTEIQLHLLLIIHLDISIQNISLVLSCEPHLKCKPKAIDNCIKRTLRKVNNPFNRGYKHRCFPPYGNITSLRLMFLSLKHVIRGHEPTIEHNVPSWSHYLLIRPKCITILYRNSSLFIDIFHVMMMFLCCFGLLYTVCKFPVLKQQTQDSAVKSGH